MNYLYRLANVRFHTKKYYGAVIPAKAGINDGIPAFAGMTGSLSILGSIKDLYNRLFLKFLQVKSQ
jgi:hypothetical protein